MITLSDSQAQILRYMCASVTRDGVVPSMYEIAQELGYHRSKVSRTLRSLEELGIIEKPAGERRAYRILQELSPSGGLMPVDCTLLVPLRAQGSREILSYLKLSSVLFPGAVSAVRITRTNLPDEPLCSGDTLVFARGAAKEGEYALIFHNNQIESEEIIVRRKPGPSYGRRLIKTIHDHMDDPLVRWRDIGGMAVGRKSTRRSQK